MTESDIKVGLKFKSSLVDDSYGVCEEITNNKFIFSWIYPNGESSKHTLQIDKVLQMFEYYGWVKLSSLEEELI